MRSMWQGVCVVVALMCPWHVTSASAATYYVSLTGNDGRSCAQAQSALTPKASLNSAVTCLRAGDTLLVRGGTYREALIQNIPAGTSWANVVRVANYPGEEVWLEPNGTLRAIEFLCNQHYIEIDGLNIEGGKGLIGDAIKFTSLSPSCDPHHIRIQNATIRNMPSQGILVATAYGDTPVIGSNEFRRLTIYGGGAEPQNLPELYGASAFYIQTPNNLVEYCDIYDVLGNGIQISSVVAGAFTSNNVIRYNRIHDIARNNEPNGRHRGIALAAGRDNQIYGNVIWNITATSAVSAGIQVTYAINTLVYNNTVYNSNKYGLRFDSETSGTVAKNNIVYGSGIADIVNFGTTGLVLSKNLTGDGSGDVASTDPLFVNRALGDFRLQSNSPAINAGTTVPYVTVDLAGSSRPQGDRIDLGAYEFRGDILLRAPASVNLSR